MLRTGVKLGDYTIGTERITKPAILVVLVNS